MAPSQKRDAGRHGPPEKPPESWHGACIYLCMRSLFQDVRYGLRLLRRSPGFTFVAMVALALGIGANTAMFTAVRSILLRPLPYPAAGRLGIVWEHSRAQGWNRINPSGPDFLDFREQSTSFEDMALFEPGTGTLSGQGEPVQVPGMRVTTNFLSLLGAKPILGRDFTPDEGWQQRVAILSYNAWQRTFGGDPRIIGSRAIADGLVYTVVGVAPPDLWLPLASDVFVPWVDSDLRKQDRMSHRFAVLARLKPGATFATASAELETIQKRIGQQFPRVKDWGAGVYPMQDALVANVRPALWIMLATVGLVLLIACTNLANLMLARAASRARETAIRTALGASRWALMRQAMTETMLLGVFGGGLGVLLALWGVDLLNTTLPATIRLPDSSAEVIRPALAVDGTVLAFTLLLSLATGVIFGLVPAFAATRVDPQEALKEGVKSTGSARARNLRHVLVVSEVALALVLLITAGLALKSFWNIQQVDPGFRTDRLLAMETELPTDSKYKKGEEMVAFFERVLENIAALPGVAASGLTSALPLDQEDHRTDYRIEGRPLPPSGQLLPANYRSVSERYFESMGIPLKRGRWFTAEDKRDRPRVAVIDEAMARRDWAGEGLDPVGQRLRVGKTVFEIIGVVGEIRSAGLDQRPQPTIYFSYRQYAEPRMTLVARHPNPEQMVNAMKQAVYAVDKDQPVYKVRTMRDALSASQSSRRFTLWLLAAFAAVALGLASAGIYGVISYAVTQRTSEIGVRIALGAGSARVMGMVVRQGMTLALIGIGLGLAAGAAAARGFGTLLYGVSPADPLVLGGTAGALALVALVATYLPARRAARIDPIVSLRYQ
jgi:putative ABC transport system permease protein